MVYFFTYKMLLRAVSEISLLEQQKQRQLDSTKAISERISSDLDSIMSRLQGLANSVYLQQGDLSGNKTIKLMKEYYLPVSTSFTTDRLLILNTSDISVVALALKGEQIFKGVNFSYRDWVGQTKSTFMPVFSNGYEGRDGKYRIAITYPIVNRKTGKYIGLVTSTLSIFKIVKEGINSILDQNGYPEMSVRIGIDVGDQNAVLH